MLLKQFPDINRVRKLRNDPGSRPADTWMNVALNVKCKEASRTGVESPYSLFLNVKGFSYCKVNGTQYLVDERTFLLSQPGEVYDLVIDNINQTEIFNIHINRDFFNNYAHTVVTPDHQLLDNPFPGSNEEFPLFTQLYPKDPVVCQRLHELKQADGKGGDAFDLALGGIISCLLKANEEIKRKITSLPAVSASVRKDVYLRLLKAKDIIQSNYSKPLDLDDLSREVAMSKFHFLRLFKAYYGTTPYQYLTGVRMEKAQYLLKLKNVSVSGISDQLGFEYPNSFIKVFRKNYGLAPLQFRNSVK